MADRLSETEMNDWVAWKRATEAVWDRVGAAIAETTGLSTADFSVLTRTAEGRQPVRQQDLADDLEWSRSRLSRQVARMEDRGLVRRSATPAATVVTATAEGRRLVVVARRAHADAVRSALLDRVTERDADSFWRVVEALRR